MLPRALTIATLLAVAVPAALADAQDRVRQSAAATAQASEETPLFEIRGLFDAGFRWRDVDGNGDKYREDLNYSTGARLFNVDLSLSPTAGGAVDLINVYAVQLGDPFESMGVTVKKFSDFNFRFRRNTSAYFYRDIILPVADSSPSLSNAGDFHHFDFDRTNDRLDFDMRVGQRGKVFFAYNRQTRLGESSTTLDISRDEFELERPLHEVKNDYTVGFQARATRVSVYVDQTYRDYENDVRLFLPGASLGEDPEDATELFFYNRLTPFDFTMPQTTVKVNARPVRRLTITGGVVVSKMDGDFSHGVVERGLDFGGNAFDSTTTASGTLARTTKLGDIDVAYDVTDRVALIGGVRVNRFTQDSDVERIDDARTAIEISSDIVEAGAQVYAATGVTITGGLRYEDRLVSLLDIPHSDDEGVEEGGEVEEPGHRGGDHVNTTRTTVFVNGTAAPSSAVSVMAEYERGDYDNPFMLLAPTAMDRIKARVRVRPVEGLALTGVFHTRRIDNDLQGDIHPTEPRLGDPTSLDTTDLTVHAAYDRAGTSVFGGYTRREIDNSVVNLLSTGTEYHALYQSDLDRVFGGTRVEVTPAVAAGTDLSYYRNRGSFGLDWEQYRFYVELLSPTGYLVKTTYQYNSLAEEDFVWDDYSAHMMTLSAGYRF